MTNSKRILAIALALLLSLPTFALADGGLFTLRLADPVLTILQGDTTITQDLTGVAVQLGGAFDLENAAPQALMSLVLLANDDPAVSAMIGLKGTELYALATGISSVLMLPVDKIEEALAEQGASIPGIGNQAAALADAGAILEKFQFTEGPAEDVQFYNATGNCPRHSAHLTSADLKDLLKDAKINVPADASMDVSYFEDGQGNVRIEGSLNDIIDSTDESDRSLGYVVVVDAQSEKVFEGGAWIGNASGEVNCNFQGDENADFPDKTQFYLVADAGPAGASTEDTVQLQISVAPNEAEDGTVSDVLNLSVLAGDQVVFTADGASYAGEDSESYSLTAMDNTTGDGMAFAYQGAITKTADGEAHAGDLSVDYRSGEDQGNLTMNLAVNTSSTTQDKFPDISGMPSLDVDGMTDEQAEQLSTEATQLMITAMGKLMAVPGIAAIIASAAQTTAG